MKWSAKIITHRGEKRIAVYFEKNIDLITRIKKIEGSQWSRSLNIWHIPNTVENQTRFKITVSLPSAEGIEAIEKFKRYLRSKRYSENTIKTYSEALLSFFTFFNSKSINMITNEDIISYNNDYILKNKLSASYQNQIINAIKLYFRTIKETKIEIEKIHIPKRAKVLPNVLSKEEVKAILNAHENIKHKAMLSMIYSCGLRRSELLNLKPSDIDSKRNVVIIRQSKGKKDRITPLSPKILDLLRSYYKECSPKTYLFEGQEKSSQYSARSLEEVLKKKALNWLQ